MRLTRSILTALPSLALAVPATTTDTPADDCIEWTSCKINGTVPGHCGKLMVPLDYTDDKSDVKTEIEILRVPAVKKPNKGSVFFNFGGPGASGIEDLAGFADRLLAATGGQYDLVNVIPRGTNNTLSFSCYTSALSRAIDAPPIAGNTSDVALGEIWARAAMFDSNCATLQNDTGRFIGTAFTARDLMRVVDILEEDKMLRYWSFSYGTLLGQTLVAMFPDKIDKLVLDGVVNPFEYYTNTESELMTSVDDVFSGFCQGCVDAPEACPLAGNFTTGPDLEEFLYQALDFIRANRIPQPDPSVPGGGALVTYSAIKALFLRQFDFPSTWPALALQFAGASGVAVGSMADSSGLGMAAATADNSDEESMAGIKCGDVLVHSDSVTELLPILQARRKLSRFGGDAADLVLARCAQWQLPAAERYDGDFSNIKTKNPLLIINNRFDPVTPLVSARNVSQTFDSVLLEQVSYGHISMSQASLCTAKAVRAYFTEGKLPKKGTVCDDVVPKLFSGETGWTEVVEQLNESNN